MNKQQILNYILNLYNNLIDMYAECNDFPQEFPNHLDKEGFITDMIKFQPGDEIIFKYKITNHWWSKEYNGKIIQISLLDRKEDEMDELADAISMMGF